MKNRIPLSVLLLAVFLVAGCASSKEAAKDTMADAANAGEAAMQVEKEAMMKEMHVLAGAWNYSLDTPQGVYTGVLMLMDGAEGLSGTITSDDQPDQAAPLENVMFDEDMSKLTFSFNGGEFGTMKVDTKLTDGKLMGMMNVGAYGVDVSMTASKKTE